ncbi:Disease resistance protein L6 [Linum perenne]
MKDWFVKESDRQGDIMEKVFSKGWSHLIRSYKVVTNEFVEIDSHVQQVRRLLSSEFGEVKIVGIHGMGGIGKTTLAKVVYNELCAQFGRFCFVEDIRADYYVKNANEGLHVIKDRVCKHKDLVVLLANGAFRS